MRGATSDPDGKRVIVRNPMSSPWREDMLTRAQELEDLAVSLVEPGDQIESIKTHLDRVRDAAESTTADGKHEPRRRWHALTGTSFERALGHLDAAEVHLLRAAPEIVIPALPSIQAHVNRYLTKDDPRRQAVDRIARYRTELVLREHESPWRHKRSDPPRREHPDELAPEELEMLLSAQHAANSQRRRDLNRLRNFRNLLFLGTVVMLLFGIALGAIGMFSPTALPLCFFPEQVNELKIACPHEEMTLAAGTSDHDDAIRSMVHSGDVWLVMLLGLLGAALTGAATLRTLGSNSTPFQVPAMLVAFKLPTGAVTAVIGLLLMRAGFVPGLSALDSPAQILGWAVVFGIAQQLVTQIADSQAAGLLQNVKGRGAAGDRDLIAQRPT